ncbi:hypothetical protein [Amycolatopsis sp. NPDC051071]|uniref:hypothetical protein n=1 Tax=Amycolatopsis sp. NPDC051071 TaxID=3154637 RepID=UPI003439B19A
MPVKKPFTYYPTRYPTRVSRAPVECFSGSHAPSRGMMGTCEKRSIPEALKGVGLVPAGWMSGLHMVWAVTEQTINDQLKLLVNNGVIERKITVGDLDKDDICLTGGIGIPTVELTNPMGPKTARLKVPIVTGTAKYLERRGRTLVSKDVSADGWCLVLRTVLNLSDKKAKVEELGKDLPESVSKILEKFTSSDFSIQQIFLDLQNANLTSFDPDASDLGTLDPGLAALIGKGLVKYFAASRTPGRNPYVLGYIAQAPHNDPSKLQPTNADFSLTRYRTSGGGLDVRHDRNTLNFLLMTGGQKVPVDAGNFTRNLVASGGAGTGYVAFDTLKKAWIESEILPAFREAVVPKNTQGDSWKTEINEKWKEAKKATWTMRTSQARTDSRKEAEAGIWDIVAVNTQKTSLSAELKPDVRVGEYSGPGFECSGYYYYKIHAKSELGWAWKSRKLPFTVRIRFTVSDTGGITSTVTTEKGKIEENSDRSWLDIYKWLMRQKNYLDQIEELDKQYQYVQQAVFDVMSQSLPHVLAGMSSQVVLPAPSQFHYRSVSLDQDLVLSATFDYRTPSPTKGRP